MQGFTDRHGPLSLGNQMYYSAGVIPLAVICGPIRGIPIYWTLVDCSFGVFGAIPLLYVLRLIRQRPPVRAGAARGDSMAV